jgi:integrase/recombinase XerD
MVYTLTHVEVVLTMKVEDDVDTYLKAEGILEKKSPLFGSVNKHRELTERPMHRNDVLGMIKRRAKEQGDPQPHVVILSGLQR